MGRMSPGDVLHVPMELQGEHENRGFSFVVQQVTRTGNAPVARYDLTCSRCSTRIVAIITDEEIDTDLRSRRHYLPRNEITETPFQMMVDGHRPRCMVRTRSYPTAPMVNSTYTVTGVQTGRMAEGGIVPQAPIQQRREENLAARATRQAVEAAKRVKKKRRERLREKHNVEITDQDIRMIRND